jgi:hypothetical protein
VIALIIDEFACFLARSAGDVACAAPRSVSRQRDALELLQSGVVRPA